MSKEIKWRIIQKKNKVVVQKKYFDFLWYSFDWELLGMFIPLLFFSGIISASIGGILYICGLPFFYSSYVVFGLCVLFVIVANQKEFDNYKDGEDFIKEKMKEKICSEITEFTWDGEKISIEKNRKE